MKNYHNDKLNFEIKVPEKWTLPAFGASQAAPAESIVFGCGYVEKFTIQIRRLNMQPLPVQTENEFKRYVQKNNYTSLEFGRIIVEDKEHAWARYYVGSGEWIKKYLVIISDIEYAFIATCFYNNKLLERERVWDEVVRSFHVKEPSTDIKLEDNRHGKDGSEGLVWINSDSGRVDSHSLEAEYGIEHPLMDVPTQSLNEVRALHTYIVSIRNHNAGKHQEGTRLYQEAILIDPDLHLHARDALIRLAQCCNPEEEGPIYYWLGIHSEHLYDYRQARIWYERATSSFHQTGKPKQEGRVHCNLGHVKFRLGDPSGMDDYKIAIMLNPMDPIAHMNIGSTYYLRGEKERALDEYAEAIFIDPNFSGPMVISRLQVNGTNWHEDYEKVAKKVAKKQGIDIDTLTIGDAVEINHAYQYYEIGNGLFESGHYAEALGQFEIGKTLSNKFSGNYLGASMTAMQMIEVGEITKEEIPAYLDRAEQNIDECIRIAPTNQDYLDAKLNIKKYKKKYHVE